MRRLMSEDDAFLARRIRRHDRHAGGSAPATLLTSNLRKGPPCAVAQVDRLALSFLARVDRLFHASPSTAELHARLTLLLATACPAGNKSSAARSATDASGGRLRQRPSPRSRMRFAYPGPLCAEPAESVGRTCGSMPCFPGGWTLPGPEDAPGTSTSSGQSSETGILLPV